jgi:tetratricopeptide (TPR) repeat protein
MGYEKPKFIETVDDGLSDPTTIEQKLARYESHPTEKDAVKLGRYNDSIGEYVKAVDYYQSAAKLSSDPAKDYAVEIFDATYYGQLKNAGFTLDDTRHAADAVLASKSTDPSDLISVAMSMTHAATRAGNHEIMFPYLKAAIERTAGTQDESLLKQRARLLPDYALYVEQDTEKAVLYKKTSLPEGWTEDSDGLNSFAWWCFENKVHLKEALKMAAKGVELAQPGKSRAAILDTQAELCNALDDCAQAVKLAKAALAEDPGSDYYKKQVQRFEDILAQKS